MAAMVPILLALLSAGGSAEVIHVADWHLVSLEAFLSEGGTEDEYQAFLDQVEAIQQQQMGVKTIWVEGKSETRR